MTTTLDSPVIGEPPIRSIVPDPGPDKLRDLEGRLERRSDRRDNWTVMMCMVAGIALIFSVIAMGLGVRAIDQSKHQVQTAPATPAPARAPAPAPAPVAVAPAVLTSVSLNDMAVTPSATVVAPGKYTVNVKNVGAVVHELLVFHTDIAPADLPIGPDGKVAEDAPGFMVSDGDNLNPGASQSRVIDLTRPGTYLFVCNLPGHFTAGMHTVVTVK